MKVVISDAAREGIELCKSGHWDEGIFCLGQVIHTHSEKNLPGQVYSFLGYGMAYRENRVRDGLKLCEKAIELSFYDADNYYNLARVHRLRGNRRAMTKTIEDGLKIDPEHAGLLAMQRKLGQRRPPVIRFLKRSHPMNVFLGRWRHRIFPPKQVLPKGQHPYKTQESPS